MNAARRAVAARRVSLVGARAGVAVALIALAGAFAPLHAQTAGAAPEFRSIGTPAAVLYDGPSLKARKMFVAPRGMPVEVLSIVGQWVKVRDQAGDIVWIERKDLADRRTVMALANVYVRSGAQDSAPIAFQFERGVMLELVDTTAVGGFVPVRHRDGSTGLVRVGEVWGY
jgi:SH3-like domain-containing protein